VAWGSCSSSSPVSRGVPALRTSPDHPLPVTLALGPTVADVLLDGPALLRVLDLRSGRAVGAYPLGIGFRARLVLDPRANRVVALLEGGAAPAGPDPWGWLPAGARHHIPYLPPPPAGPTLHPASATIFDTARL